MGLALYADEFERWLVLETQTSNRFPSLVCHGPISAVVGTVSFFKKNVAWDNYIGPFPDSLFLIVYFLTAHFLTVYFLVAYFLVVRFLMIYFLTILFLTV